MGITEEETFDNQGITGKEIILPNHQLMAFLLVPRAKESASTAPRTRWSKARIFLKDARAYACETIELSERVKLKDKMKCLASKRGVAEAGLNGSAL